MALYVQIVEMDVEFLGSDIGADEEEAMLQLFAYQPAIQFRSGAPTKYQSLRDRAPAAFAAATSPAPAD